jgi:hypothetical protein
MCERFDANPALVALRGEASLDRLIELVVDFWSTEERVLAQLYGVAAVDPAARDLVERQRRDRYAELKRILGGSDALPQLALLTSFETYLELRRGVGLSQKRVVETLKDAAHRLVQE